MPANVIMPCGTLVSPAPSAQADLHRRLLSSLEPEVSDLPS